MFVCVYAVCFSETVAIRISGPRMVHTRCEAKAPFLVCFHHCTFQEKKNVGKVRYCNRSLLTVKVFNYGNSIYKNKSFLKKNIVHYVMFVLILDDLLSNQCLNNYSVCVMVI